MLTVDEGIAAYHKLMRGDEAARLTLHLAGYVPMMLFGPRVDDGELIKTNRGRLRLERLVRMYLEERMDKADLASAWAAVHLDTSLAERQNAYYSTVEGLAEWLYPSEGG